MYSKTIIQGNRMCGGVAQLVEHRTENPCVTSSILVLATIFFALTAKKYEAVRLRFMPRWRCFMISMIASYGEAVLHFSACR